MQAFRFAANYLLYFLRALDEHSLHSPLVFHLYNEVIKGSHFDSRQQQIEELRADLLKDDTSLNITDFGAGTSQQIKKKRKISSIAKKSIAPIKKSQLLYRLIFHYQPTSIIELGTCLGINTLYLALHGKEVITFEGCPNCANRARNYWKNFQFAEKIQLIEGNIDDTLPAFMQNEASTDFVFIDANHTYEATIHYFNLLVSKAHTKTLIVIDDIHWSADMQKAWQEIQKRDEVFLTIDLFHLGLVLFKPLYLRQHYVLEF